MNIPALSMAMPMSIPCPKGRILCVDDEPNILRALSWLLQKEFEVVTATSGKEGLELVRSDDFDVVISDQHMPEMSGVDFLLQAKAIAPRAMRILLADYADIQAILSSENEADIYRYVTKPWNVSELPGIVAQAAEIACSRYPAIAPETEEAAVTSGVTKILVLDEKHDVRVITELVAGDLAPLIHTDNLADAFQALEDEGIGVIVGEFPPGSAELTQLLRHMKQKRPEVLSIVLGPEADSEEMAGLVSGGQIDRFVPIPVAGAHFRRVLQAVLEKSRQLRSQPAPAARQAMTAATAAKHAGQETRLQATCCSSAAPPSLPLLAGRTSAFLQRLFGLARGRA